MYSRLQKEYAGIDWNPFFNILAFGIDAVDLCIYSF